MDLKRYLLAALVLFGSVASVYSDDATLPPARVNSSGLAYFRVSPTNIVIPSTSRANTWTGAQTVIGGVFSSGPNAGFVAGDVTGGAGLGQFYRNGSTNYLWDSVGGNIISYSATGINLLKPVTAQSIDGTPIGQTTPAAGGFDSIRATGSGIPTSGAGLEMSFSGGIGSFTSYDRGSNTYHGFLFNGSIYTFYVSGSVIGSMTPTGLNGMAIGQSAPAAGAFTTLTATTPVAPTSGGTGLNAVCANGKAPVGNGSGYTCQTVTTTTSSRVLLNTVNVSAGLAAIQDTTSITSTYSEYEIVCTQLVPTANTSTGLQMQVYQGGAYTSSGYMGASYNMSGTSVSQNADTADMSLSASITSSSTYTGFTGIIRFSNPSNTNKTVFTGNGTGTTTSPATYTTDFGTVAPAGAITGFQLKMGGTTFASGSCKVYGWL